MGTSLKHSEIMQGVQIAYPPRYTFPDDELVSPDNYESVMHQGYLTAFLLAESAMNALGESMPSDAAERTKRMTGAAAVFDDILDESESPEAGYNRYVGIIEALGAGTYTELELTPDDSKLVEPSVILLGNAVRGFGEHAIQEYVKLAMNLGNIALLKRKISDPFTYQRVVANEGRTTGKIMALSALSGKRETRSARDKRKITRFITGLVTIKSMNDSVHDLEEDNENGLTSVEPTPRAKEILLARAEIERNLLVIRRQSREYLRALAEKEKQVAIPDVLY